jgi:hypothetical protein
MLLWLVSAFFCALDALFWRLAFSFKFYKPKRGLLEELMSSDYSPRSMLSYRSLSRVNFNETV